MAPEPGSSATEEAASLTSIDGKNNHTKGPAVYVDTIVSNPDGSTCSNVESDVLHYDASNSYPSADHVMSDQDIDSGNSPLVPERVDECQVPNEVDTFLAAIQNLTGQETGHVENIPEDEGRASNDSNTTSLSSKAGSLADETTHMSDVGETGVLAPIRASMEPENGDNDLLKIEHSVNTKQTSEGHRVFTVKRTDRVEIDLTMEDDDEPSPNLSLGVNRTLPLFPRIKIEPEDDYEREGIIEYSKLSVSAQNKFHGLPELNANTPLDMISFSGETGATEWTADRMASWLQEYIANSAGYCSPTKEPDSDEEDAQARMAFAMLKRGFEERKDNHNVTPAEEIDFDRATNEEDARQRLRQSRKQHAIDEVAKEMQEQSIFIPEHEDFCNPQDADEGASLYVSASVERSPALDANSDHGPAKQSRGRDGPGGTSSKSTEKKPAGRNRVSKKQQRTADSTKRRKKAKEQAIVNTNRLLHHDIIAEANANEGQGPQPSFTSRVKKDALAQLISSIPAEERNLYAGDKANLDKASKNFVGRGAIRADGNGNWNLKGMKSSLQSYQLLGVSWMRSRENDSGNPHGGILSDDMGLGKTVSALANIVDGMPASNHRGPRATLIIVPPSLMSQWMSEIQKHVEVFSAVMVYRAKMKFLDPIALLGSMDVVVTSYHEVARSLPKNNPPPEIHTPQAKSEWWAKEISEKRGPLHKIYWHRIVLDEAQAIKNHLSKTSEAVCHLRGRYRWCLSGTPIQNSLEEFYPFFRFLKCDNTGSFELFKRNFVKRGSDKAVQRLQVYLGKIMLRRTHQDKLFGRPILVLPSIKPVENIVVKFNRVERAVYNIVRNRFVMRIRALAKADDPNKSYSVIFTLLLRLRQLAGHPLLIQKTLKDLLETEDLERLRALAKAGGGRMAGDESIGSDGSRETAQTLQVALTLSSKISSSSVNVSVADNQLSMGFRKYLDSLRQDGHWARANERSLCCACGSPPTRPYISSCLHLYCFACLNDLRFCELMKSSDAVTCLQCGAAMRRSEAFAATDAGRRKTLNGRETPDEDIDWYTIGGPILRSAKIKGAAAQIKKWFQQDHSNKIIVFTLFRGMIKIMERVCREEEWGYASYHGAMAFDYRDDQIRRFSENPECKILLAAMKAGGVGLNLTAANRVIILDLWWNASVENQAFTRCFRIGQTRDVEVARFVVHDSIDADIQKMQQGKMEEIKKAMETENRPKLSTKELLELFDFAPETGNQGESTQSGVVMDGEDEPFIFPDDPYDKGDEDDDVMMLG